MHYTAVCGTADRLGLYTVLMEAIIHERKRSAG